MVRILEGSSPKDDIIIRINVVTHSLNMLFMYFLQDEPDKTYDKADELHYMIEAFRYYDVYLDYAKMKKVMIYDHYDRMLINPQPQEEGGIGVPPNAIFLLVGVDSLPMKYVLHGILNNVFFAGLSLKRIYADGDYICPRRFYIHDTEHAYDYLRNFYDKKVKDATFSLDELKSFYDFLKAKENNAKTKEEKADMYRINLIFYLS